MKKRIAINGFGRIGRLTFRNLCENPEVEVVAINDLTDNATLAHLLKYDTAHGKFNGTVTSDEESITVNGNRIQAMAERDPSKLPWESMNIDVVLECTGFFRTKESANKHVEAGAKKVIISAPGKGEGIETVVLGVNNEGMDKDACILSNASCTTNCLAPVIKVLEENWGIDKGSLTTIHAYTSDQKIQDAPHSDLRRARAAAVNMVPTSTGAAVAVGKVYPEVEGKLFAMAVRVPTITGSLIELNVWLNKDATVEEINSKFKEQSEGALKGILEYNVDPIVSSDIIGNKASSIFDAPLTKANGRMVKVVSWYDNEAGYSARLADLAAHV